jgi:WD40-like Beta Propeller Repeat
MGAGLIVLHHYVQQMHQATISVAVLYSAGKLVMEANLEAKPEVILQFIHGLPGGSHVTIEEGIWRSPNGRWIVFEATKEQSRGTESVIYVVPVASGPWIHVTEGTHSDDKPRWSPDGNMIYSLSERAGFL